MHSCYHPQRSWGKVMFLQVCVILFTGGGVPDQVHPPWDQVHPPGPGTPAGQGTPPRTRYTPPWDQVHPPGTRYTPRPGTPPPPNPPTPTRYTPWDQVHPPKTRYTPQPGPGTSPGTREIWSTCGRYASYWNAFLCANIFDKNCMKLKRRVWGHGAFAPPRSATELM